MTRGEVQLGVHWPSCVDGACAGCMPAVLAPAHEHKPTKGALGLITCEGCGAKVPQPPGMPDYTGATMAKW